MHMFKAVECSRFSGMERSGTAPGDNCVRLKSLSVSGGNMQDGLVDIQKDFQINVDYQVLSHCQGINVRIDSSRMAAAKRSVCSSNLRSLGFV